MRTTDYTDGTDKPKQEVRVMNGLAMREHLALVERCRELKSENALLRGDLTRWVAASDESRLGLLLPMPPLVEALHKELEQAKSENARLAAALEWLLDEQHWPQIEGRKEQWQAACRNATDELHEHRTNQTKEVLDAKAIEVIKRTRRRGVIKQ